MLKPYLMTTLITIAQMANKDGVARLTTADLAQRLGTSQQTSSRYLIELDKSGLILRRKRRAGEEVSLTPKALQELSSIHLSLKKIFEQRPKELLLVGEVFSGLGEGAYYVGKPGYLGQFEKSLGIKPFPGTLNIRLTGQSLKDRPLIGLFEPILIEGFTDGERSFGPVKCYRALLNGRARCFVITALRTHYGSEILEVIAGENLRERLSLRDGSRVTVKIY
ncbi:MAG: DUF120 domain-containing protein [Candidatus Bathyarchaeia archaeon]